MDFDRLLFLISTIRLLDIIDILIISFVLYKLFAMLKGTRAIQLIKGILFIFVFAKLSEIIGLYTINWILDKALTVGVIALLIVFQPELRRILEQIGTNSLLKKNISPNTRDSLEISISDVVKSIFALADKKIGALIVIERNTGLKDVVETGISIDSKISYELLMNIFIPNTPLHDGAVIIRNDRIVAASCFLPLSDNKNISMELGTRHRAGIGMSEKSDSIVLIASEESGGVSIAENGVLHRHLSEEYVREYLLNNVIDNFSTDGTSSIKDLVHSIFLKFDKSVDVDNSEKKDLLEVKEEVKEEIKQELKEEISDIIENKGDIDEK